MGFYTTNLHPEARVVPPDDPDPNGGGGHQVEVKVLDGGHARGTQPSIHPVVE